MFQKKGVGTRRQLRRSWRLRRQISLDYMTTALSPNLTRLLHNTASYAGYGVTRWRFEAQHSVATLLRRCFVWSQHCSNIATLGCAENRRCESSPPPARKKFLRKEQPRGTGGSCRSQAFHHYELWLSEAKNRNILQGKITTSGFQESVSWIMR